MQFIKVSLQKTFSLPLMALLLLSLVLAACGDSPTPVPAANTTAAAAQPTQANAVAAAPAPKTINIDMISFKFSPQEISVPAGSTVIWTNKDAAKHNVVADDKAFESPTLEKGQSFSRKFDTPGVITYFCSFHGGPGAGMVGKLTITPAAAGAVAAPTTQAATIVAIATTAAAPTVAATTAARTVAATVATATTAAATQAPTAQAATAGEAVGTVNFRDDTKLTDGLIVNFPKLAEPPSGMSYFGWLQNSADGTTLKIGQIIPGANGQVNLRFATPDKGNILAAYDKFVVTHEALDPTPSAPSSMVAYSGQLPGPSLIHIRHLLVSFPATPNKIGLEVGLRDQTNILRRHSEFLVDALKQDDLAAIKLHAEHLVNIIEGSKGPDYGDLNKDGQVTNPGDGYGLLKNGDQLGYLNGSKEHAGLAAKAEGATEAIKLHAGHVGITVDNATGWVTAIRDRSLSILKVTTTDAAAPMVQEISTLSNQVLNGVDLSGDGVILPIPGSGGVITSYQHAQLIGSIPLALPGAGPVASTGGHDHTATPVPITGKGTPVAGKPNTTVAATSAVAAATTTAAAGAGALGGPGQEIKMDITGFKFSKNPITIKAGTKITWTNQDTAPHTATADNSSWDSGTLQKGQSFSFVFNKPGQVSYHCEIHPNMIATITVVE